MAARKAKIDLLSREGLAQRPAGKFLLWALTFGRYIVIFTELIVITGFVVRIVLDQQNNSVTEDIQEQQTILASYQPVEERIRLIHEQIETVERLDKERLRVADIYDDLSRITPLDMQFNSMNINEQSLEISAIVLSPAGFSSFIRDLQEINTVSDVILDSVESRGAQDPSLQFLLTAELVNSKTLKTSGRKPAQSKEKESSL